MAHRFIKGGIWKNSEDEILKAAVMKYGKNQWSRIASLMNRKSAKQCKARWYEWLDPSIKKTEWSREEEEKLLHLAKIMPCQWRTIAPIIGRTAAQCLAHYEKLLDQATGRENDPDDPRKLRPGEIDPNPETKPALPDMVDMDDDEKEMLQEARARLANTRGKKAKRKAREKQLEEARRLAMLQKRREMKAAGLDTGLIRKKRKMIDYVREIPFQRKPPPGFYDASAELAKPAGKISLKGGISLEQLEGPRRDEEEQKLRKEDIKKAKERAEKDPLADILKQKKLEEMRRAAKRGKLNLPEPQISDAELEELAKITYEPEVDDAATGTLLSSYVPSATPARGGATPAPITERTPARPDTVMSEAQNLARITAAATPLLGGENPVLNPSDFSGATPKTSVVSTPNPLLTPLRQQATERALVSGKTPRRTPVRDQLSINTPSRALEEESLAAQKLQAKSLREKLKAGLASLPRPKNEVKLVMPDDEEDSMAVDSSLADAGTSAKIADASTVEQKEQLRKQAQKTEIDKLVTAAFREGVPTDEELKQLEKEMERAEELIKLELKNDKDYKPFTRSIPSEVVVALEQQFTQIRERMKIESKRAASLEKRLAIYHGGYIKRADNFEKDIAELQAKIEQAALDLAGYKLLYEQEKIAIPQRLKEMEAIVQIQQDREKRLQQRYAELTARKAAILRSIQV